MTVDVSRLLLSAQEAAWTANDFATALKMLSAGAPSATLDWDADAGEGCARLSGKGETLALVARDLALVVATRRLADDLGRTHLAQSAVIVSVSRMDRAELASDPTTLYAVTGRRSAAVDPTGFSGDDFYYLLV